MVQENNVTTHPASPLETIKEEALAEHRITRVLPRSQFELREQEESLADLTIRKAIQKIFNEVDKITFNAEQKSKIQELKQKYGLL